MLQLSPGRPNRSPGGTAVKERWSWSGSPAPPHGA